MNAPAEMVSQSDADSRFARPRQGGDVPESGRQPSPAPSQVDE